MRTLGTPFVTSLLLLILAGAPLRAGQHELATVDSAVDVVEGLSHLPLKGIPIALMRDARGVAVFPHVMKFGLLVDRRFGHGVVLVRQPDGSWSSPLFVTLEGGGFGLEAGVEATDLVLVFKNPQSLEHIVHGKGKLTLGSDASVAAGPLGRELEIASDKRLKIVPDVYAYSRSRGLFAGVALEGARINVDGHANDVFYGQHGCGPGMNAHAAAVVETLKAQLTGLSGPGAPIAPVVVPVPTAAPVPVPPPPPPHPWWQQR
jgi:lipid-binding SYLF domain-containing protein